jgi:hypothetical protein
MLAFDLQIVFTDSLANPGPNLKIADDIAEEIAAIIEARTDIAEVNIRYAYPVISQEDEIPVM